MEEGHLRLNRFCNLKLFAPSGMNPGLLSTTCSPGYKESSSFQIYRYQVLSDMRILQTQSEHVE